MAMVKVRGYAHVTETPFEMQDEFGPYTEIFAKGAFEKSVKANPDVVLRANHRELPMASTYSGSLRLWSDDTGLGFEADVDDARRDVADMLQAIRSGDMRETSFAGWIYGDWNKERDEFRVTEVDLHRGDVSPVTYGANPEGRVGIAEASEAERSLMIRLKLAEAA